MYAVLNAKTCFDVLQSWQSGKSAPFQYSFFCFFSNELVPTCRQMQVLNRHKKNFVFRLFSLGYFDLWPSKLSTKQVILTGKQ